MKAALVLLAALALIDVAPAAACSGLPEEPTAELLNVPGSRPWIQMFLVKDGDAVEMSIVDKARCLKERPRDVCPGKPVELERTGPYVRAKAPLPAGALIQLVSGNHTLASFTVPASPGRPELPAWNGVKVKSSRIQAAAGCAPKGPVVTLQAQKTTANLENTVLLVYMKKPDATDRMKELAFIRVMNAADAAGDGIMTLRNAKLDPTFMPAAVPKKMWVAIADSDGHVGTPIELSLTK